MKTNIQIISTSSDGIISFSISDKRYTYSIDAALIPYVSKIAEYTPGKAFNFVKEKGELLK